MVGLIFQLTSPSTEFFVPIFLQEAFARACRDVAEGLQRVEELLSEQPFLSPDGTGWLVSEATLGRCAVS